MLPLVWLTVMEPVTVLLVTLASATVCTLSPAPFPKIITSLLMFAAGLGDGEGAADGGISDGYFDKCLNEIISAVAEDEIRRRM